MKAAIIIPSRYSSVRLPGKALKKLEGKPMVQWVYEACKKVSNANDVIVATDNENIEAAVKQFNGKVLMTSVNHKSGTDRCAEVAINLNEEYIINVQGDEPFIDPSQLEKMIQHLIDHPSIEILTLYHRITNLTEVEDPAKVKLTKALNGKVLYFSRSPLPYNRGGEKISYFKHVGIYAFKKSILLELADLPESELESTEGLEQLRWLENGYEIYAIEVEGETMGVDTPEDLERARVFAKNRY